MKRKVKGKALAILMSLAMAFTMMPMIGGAVYADDTDLYTVTILPGEGTGTPITVTSETVFTWQEARAREEEAIYDLTQGCFFNAYGTGDLEYKLPLKCGFAAPQDKELEGWQINGGVLNGHTSNPGAECPLSWIFDDGSTSATITAIWKDVEPDPTIEYSTPEEINVSYGDTRTTFDIKVTERSFTQGKTYCAITLYDAAFTCGENGGSLPFTVDGNRGGRSQVGTYFFLVESDATLPYTDEAYIDISSSAWEAAEPGNYTATLQITDGFGGARNIPLTLTVPDKSIEHTVTVTNNGNGTASADPQSGTWGTEVTLTATPNPGYVFKEWQVISGGVMVSNDKFTIGTEDVEIKAIFVKPVDVPEGKTLTYNGEEQSGVEAGEGYELINASATNADSYEATATLKDGYVWADGSTEPKIIEWTIDKATVKVAAPAGKTFTYNGKAKTGVAAGANYTLSGTVKATKAGTFTAKATLKTNANYVYKWADGTTAVKSINWKINKAANPLAIKAKIATVKGSTKGKKGKLKKNKTLAVAKVIAFTKKGQGKMTYTKASGTKKITINKTTGKVTVKKGLRKGTYKVKVKVKAAGNANYKVSAWKTVTFNVKVK